jgi:hypothetical protein
MATVLSSASACNSKPKRDFSRYIIEVESVGGVTVTVAGRPVPLEPGKLDRRTWVEGMIDFKESEVSSKTRPEVTVHTPCGPKPVELKPSALSAPNESNVVTLRLSRYDLPKGTAFVFAPGVQGPVTIGDITVAPIPRELTVYDARCGKPITVGTTASPIEGDGDAVIVAPSTSACLKAGVALYGKEGAKCKPASSQRLTGKLVYPLAERPQVLFESMDTSIKISGSECLNRSWVQDC